MDYLKIEGIKVNKNLEAPTFVNHIMAFNYTWRTYNHLKRVL